MRATGEEGIALVLTLMAMTLLSALGLALMLLTIGETRIAAHYDAGIEALSAAEGVAAVVAGELSTAPWNAVLAGTAASAFTDGPPAGRRSLPDGSTLDLLALTNRVRCGKVAECSEADLNGAADRPWGANNPRWRLYAYGPIDSGGPSGVRPGAFAAAWVADDPAETDGDPLRDGDTPDNPGRGVIMVLAHGYGAYGARRVIELTLERVSGPGPPRLRLLAWRERLSDF